MRNYYKKKTEVYAIFSTTWLCLLAFVVLYIFITHSSLSAIIVSIIWLFCFTVMEYKRNKWRLKFRATFPIEAFDGEDRDNPFRKEKL